MRNILIVLFLLICSPAFAQTCPTRPIGDNSNACASTAFVNNQIGSSVPLPLPVADGGLYGATLNAIPYGGGAGTLPSFVGPSANGVPYWNGSGALQAGALPLANIAAIAAISILCNSSGSPASPSSCATLPAVSGFNFYSVTNPAYGGGAKCDGVTNDTTPIQDAINAAISAGGGIILFPAAATCVANGGLTEDVSSYSTQFKPVVSFMGAGPAKSILECNSLSGPCLNIIGSTTNDEAYITISNLQISGSGTSGSIGLQTNQTAFLHLINFVIEGFAIGWNASNLEQSTIEHSNFRFNVDGLILNGATGVGNVTGSNSLSFYDVAISSNSGRGLTVKDFASVNFFDGSLQYNGGVGTSGDYGALFEDTASGSFCGYNTVSFFGTVFEGNGGDFDLSESNNFCPGAQLNVVGASFIRVHLSGVDTYATNNIRMSGSVAQSLSVVGTTFIYGVGYTPNGARPTIGLPNTSASVFDNGSNYFQSSAEQGAALGWVPYTPTITCGSGSLTTYTASGRYKLTGGKTVHLYIQIAISSLGTCSGALNATMPSGVTVNSTGNIYTSAGEDSNIGGLIGFIAFHNGGTDEAQFFGFTPAAHTYFGTVEFETP